jgi:hypothetical protein
MLSTAIYEIIVVVKDINYFKIARILRDKKHENVYSTRSKMMYWILIFFSYSLVMIYWYFNIKTIRIKKYAFELLKSIGKEGIYEEFSIFVIKSKLFKRIKTADSLNIEEMSEKLSGSLLSEVTMMDTKETNHLEYIKHFKINTST